MIDVIRNYFDMLGFPHLYTKTPITSGPRDSWNKLTKVEGTLVDYLACHFTDEGNVSISNEGVVTITKAYLNVPFDDNLAVGDKITQIVNKSDEVVLFTGTLVVEQIANYNPAGPVICKMAIVRTADA